jgi:hypothetical protein
MNDTALLHTLQQRIRRVHKYVRTFAEAWPSEQIVQQVVAQFAVHDYAIITVMLRVWRQPDTFALHNSHNLQLPTQRGHVALQRGDAMVFAVFQFGQLRLGDGDPLRQFFLSQADSFAQGAQIHLQQFLFDRIVNLLKLISGQLSCNDHIQ